MFLGYVLIETKKNIKNGYFLKKMSFSNCFGSKRNRTHLAEKEREMSAIKPSLPDVFP
jgi:hypothetical protein